MGNHRRLPLGRLTHHLLVRDKLVEEGFSGLNDNTVQRITEKVRGLAEKKGRFVTKEELAEIARREAG